MNILKSTGMKTVKMKIEKLNSFSGNTVGKITTWKNIFDYEDDPKDEHICL